MKKQKRMAAGLLAAVLVTAAVGSAFAAGDKSDPLVTLSYLEQTVIPAIVQQAEKAADSKKTALTAEFDKKLAEYEKQLNNSSSGGDSATYSVVTLSQGQQLKLEVGCEVMLRIGSAAVVSGTEPGLIDVTTGGTLNNGKALEKNHLYMATIADRAVKAGAATVKLLIRGGYTLA